MSCIIPDLDFDNQSCNLFWRRQKQHLGLDSGFVPKRKRGYKNVCYLFAQLHV